MTGHIDNLAGRVSGRLRCLAAAAALALAALAVPAGAATADVVNQTTFGGVAIDGYDPVAYFTEGEPVEGSSAYAHDWMGAEWHFASAEHLAMFKENPKTYAPKYGGYCAWAVSRGDTAGIDPDAWRIVDGELYLNYSQAIQERWEQDIPGNIRAADENWPEIKAGL